MKREELEKEKEKRYKIRKIEHYRKDISENKFNAVYNSIWVGWFVLASIISIMAFDDVRNIDIEKNLGEIWFGVCMAVNIVMSSVLLKKMISNITKMSICKKSLEDLEIELKVDEEVENEFMLIDTDDVKTENRISPISDNTDMPKIIGDDRPTIHNEDTEIKYAVSLEKKPLRKKQRYI